MCSRRSVSRKFSTREHLERTNAPGSQSAHSCDLVLSVTLFIFPRETSNRNRPGNRFRRRVGKVLRTREMRIGWVNASEETRQDQFTIILHRSPTTVDHSNSSRRQFSTADPNYYHREGDSRRKTVRNRRGPLPGVIRRIAGSGSYYTHKKKLIFGHQIHGTSIETSALRK